MRQDIEKRKYEFALQRIEALLPLVDDTEEGASSPEGVELIIMSDIVEAYEKEHFPMEKPTISELIQLSLEEKGLTQKQLAAEIGISQARISDYIAGRAEPTLRIARLLCTTLGIAPALMLGV